MPLLPLCTANTTATVAGGNPAAAAAAADFASGAQGVGSRGIAFLNESCMALVPRLGFKKLAASLETCSTTTRKRHGPLAMGYLLRHKSGFTASP